MLQSKDIGWQTGLKKKKKKKKTLLYVAYKRLTSERHKRLKVREWKKIFHTNETTRVEVVIFISGKVDFKAKAITKDKEGHCIMKKGSTQEYITLIKIGAPNTGTPKYIKQILTDIKGDIDNNKIMLGNFNTRLTSIDRSFRQKINKATVVLNDTTDRWT